jgi:hypothetical protein
MVMTADQATSMFEGRRPGNGMVTTVDRTREFRRAGRRTAAVRAMRLLCPLGAVALLGLYGLSIVRTAGLVDSETLTGISVRKILPEDLAMKNPRYEGFNKARSTSRTRRAPTSPPGAASMTTTRASSTSTRRSMSTRKAASRPA